MMAEAFQENPLGIATGDDSMSPVSKRIKIVMHYRWRLTDSS